VQVFFDGSARPTYERVVLVTIDTLRVDHVSSYGYPRETTPFLDSLAARGVRFEEVLASVSHTAPSHATMLTGLVPRAHGVLVNGASLAPEALDLARVFAQAGYETAAFLNVAFLKRIAGSFETVEVRPVARGEGNQSARDVVDAVLAWARERRKSPRFFLWVHVYDPHEWEPRVRAQHGREESLWSGTSPADFAGRAAELHGLPPPEPGRPLSVPMPGGKEDASGVFGSDKLLRCIDAYDQRILEADREIARLAAGLEALVLPGRALWIVTSDHGEGLASHGYAGHTGRIFQEQLRVPLVLSASDGSLGPRVVPELVAHTDLFATLVETLGGRVAANEQMHTGRSLLPLARGEPVAWPARAHLAQRRPVTDPREKDRAEMYALQDGRHKLLRVEPGPDSLFDLRQDPLELHDLGPAAAEASELGRRLDEILRMFSEHALPAPAGPLPQDVLEELRALGYVR
jgi:arylsulfatase A-like enzyme